MTQTNSSNNTSSSDNYCANIYDVIYGPRVQDTERKVYFYTDSSHVSIPTQESIINKVSSGLENQLFDVIFVEGRCGKLDSSRFESEEQIYKAFEENTLGALAIHILSHQSKNKAFKVYGVDNQYLLSEHLKIKKELMLLQEQIENKQYIWQNNILNGIMTNQKYTHLRSMKAADNIYRYMKNHNLDTAALIFGLGHASEIITKLNRYNIKTEVITSSPGNASSDKYKKYILNVAKEKNI